jgi:hypothetical protein
MTGGRIALFVIWSAICWVAYGAVKLVAWLLYSVGLGGVPILGWLIDAAYGLSVWIIVLVWLIVGAIVLLASGGRRRA